MDRKPKPRGLRHGGRLARQKRIWIAIPLIILYLAFCVWRYTESRRPLRALYGSMPPNGKTVHITLEITGYPETKEDKLVMPVSLDGAAGRLTSTTYETQNPMENLRPGDRAEGYFKLYEHPLNADVFYAYPQGEVVLHPREDGVPLRYLPNTWAKSLFERLALLFEGDALAFLAGLLCGNRSAFTDTLSQMFFTTGLSHVTAVSGLHVSMLTGFLTFVLRKRRAAVFIALPVLLLYTAVTGFSASAMRAALMCAVYLIVPLFGRDYDRKRALAFAFLLMTAYNPRLLFSPSFQISFAATLGLTLFGDRFRAALCAVPWGTTKLWGFAASALSAAFASLALSLPFAAYWFDGISLIAPLSNLLLLWLVSLIFLFGALALILSFVYLPLGVLLAVPASLTAKVFLGGAGLLAKIPYAVLYKSQPYLMIWLVFAYTLLITALLARRARWPLCTAAAAFVLCFTLTILRPARGRMQITLLDVGQGQCLLLRAGGQTAVLDCGGSVKAGLTALRALQSMGENHIDYLILSHYDADHVNGVPLLLEGITVGRVIGPKAATLPDYPVDTLQGEENLTLGEARLRLQATDWIGGGNERCVTVLAEIGSFSLLCTGDIGASTERWLLRTADFPELDVLVAGHHGSGASASAELLDALRPAAALISVGQGNSYGHPHKDTLARLEERGIDVYRSDTDGTVEIIVN